MIRMLRILRITRLLRTLRIIQVVRMVDALRTLVLSIISTFQALAWAILLLAIIVYVFAILFTQLVTIRLAELDQLQVEHQCTITAYEVETWGKACLEEDPLFLYWGSIGKSMWTL